MPWASQAQRRKFYADPALHKYIPEFNAATPAGAKLPQRVRPKHPTATRKRIASAAKRRLARR